MFEVQAEVHIARPLEHVFAFIADNENDPQWCVPLVETTRVSGNRPGLGARYTFASRVGIARLGGEFEITEFEPPLRIGWRGTSPFGTYVGEYLLAPGDDGLTRLVESVTFQYRGLWHLLESLSRRQFAGNYQLQLQRLKELLELGPR
jgi:uncharacterized protein YndB with AHSA1/START domain